MKKVFILGMYLFTSAVCAQAIFLEVRLDGTMILHTDTGLINITALSKQRSVDENTARDSQRATIFTNDDFAYTSDPKLEYQLRVELKNS